uniref:Uncharacterized protein AlNc14C6G836 n=1 Tax=Albugo laibachii Nc14 TaxID=890382 RepID=F0W160_9STRA|nr:PREDICTED: hypothetical protein LOC100487240 [Albugo laibachii Nc14]|eukprot:CCA14785.1 PREDICTED: hypothetical protein LOC100487240 [Albugo laibachii Nc14]
MRDVVPLSLMPADGNVTLGSLKGVMLCNRPYENENRISTSMPSEKEKRPDRLAFVAGVPAEPIGYNVPIHVESTHGIKRDKSHTALAKHRKWLFELQNERNRLGNLLEKEEEKRMRRKELFSQREAFNRHAIRNGVECCSEIVKASREKMLRPMWALTEESANEKEEWMDDTAAEELISFADDLDIDSFMDDVETKARVAQVDQQLAQVESLVRTETALENRVESDHSVVPLTAANLAALPETVLDDDTESVATSILSEKSIRSVHSTRSIAALTRRVQAKIDEEYLAPRVITVDESDGARMNIKSLPSNLPYIHRNPAI